MSHRRPLAHLLPVAVAVAAIALAACGSQSGDGETTAPAPATAAASEPALPDGAPAALRANTDGANELVGEGADALNQRLAKLEGHPVVVNQWASWCGPCRFELPFFADAVGRHGAKVAFVGIDYMDSRDGGEALLLEQRPGFASVFDPDGAASRSIAVTRGMPTTFFLGRDGRVVHTKIGGYADAAQLDADIRRYALGAS